MVALYDFLSGYTSITILIALFGLVFGVIGVISAESWKFRTAAFLALMLGIAALTVRPALGYALQEVTPATAVVKGSVQITCPQCGKPETLVQLEGYDRPTVLRYDGHYEFKAGSTVKVNEVRIGGTVRRITP